MQKEFSAGGIVFKKRKALSGNRKEEDLLWLVAQHSQHKGWVFPKGLIGDNIKGESTEDTAIREVKEETGVEGKIVTKLENPVTYWYVWEGDKRFKTVSYFIMEYKGGDITKHDHEMSDVEWLATNEVEKRLSYKSDREAFQEALKLLKTNN